MVEASEVDGKNSGDGQQGLEAFPAFDYLTSLLRCLLPSEHPKLFFDRFGFRNMTSLIGQVLRAGWK